MARKRVEGKGEGTKKRVVTAEKSKLGTSMAAADIPRYGCTRELVG